MGLLTDYLRQRHNEDLNNKMLQMDAYRSVLNAPDVRPEAKQYAFDQIVDLAGAKNPGKNPHPAVSMIHALKGLLVGGNGQPQQQGGGTEPLARMGQMVFPSGEGRPGMSTDVPSADPRLGYVGLPRLTADSTSPDSAPVLRGSGFEPPATSQRQRITLPPLPETRGIFLSPSELRQRQYEDTLSKNQAVAEAQAPYRAEERADQARARLDLAQMQEQARLAGNRIKLNPVAEGASRPWLQVVVTRNGLGEEVDRQEIVPGRYQAVLAQAQGLATQEAQKQGRAVTDEDVEAVWNRLNASRGTVQLGREAVQDTQQALRKKALAKPYYKPGTGGAAPTDADYKALESTKDQQWKLWNEQYYRRKEAAAKIADRTKRDTALRSLEVENERKTGKLQTDYLKGIDELNAKKRAAGGGGPVSEAEAKVRAQARAAGVDEEFVVREARRQGHLQ